jgi:hypothetical protein
MDHELTGTPEAASEPTPPLSVGGLFIEALARRDFAALAGCLQPGVRLRALLPDGPAEMTGCEEVAGWFRSLFGGPEELELADATVGEVGPRLYMRWRVTLTAPGPSGPRHLVEQHVFAASGERISALDLLCSGFVTQPNTAIYQQGRMPCLERQ